MSLLVKNGLGRLGHNPVRVYLIALALAVLPLSLFLVTAHKLLQHQVIQKSTAQSGQSGNLIGKLLEQHLTESSVFLQSFAARPSLLAEWQTHRFQEIEKDLKQAHGLRPDFLFFAVYDLQGNL